MPKEMIGKIAQQLDLGTLSSEPKQLTGGIYASDVCFVYY